MCGRFILGDGSWAEYHEALSILRDVRGTVCYNIKPTQSVSLAYMGKTGIAATTARWWFVPEWFKGTNAEWKATTFNARIETAAEKPVFRGAWRSGRCLIPASGYYEWTGEKGRKQPWFITVEQNAPVFFFAGLYAARPGEDASCTILTRAADPALAHLHPRMPVMLSEEEILPWLTQDIPEEETVDKLGTRWAGRFRFHHVRPFGIADDGPELIEADGFHF